MWADKPPVRIICRRHKSIFISILMCLIGFGTELFKQKGGEDLSSRCLRVSDADKGDNL